MTLLMIAPIYMLTWKGEISWVITSRVKVMAAVSI